MIDVTKIRIETDRLILRPPNAYDLDGFAAMMADPESARYIGETMTRSQAWRTLCMMVGAWHVRGFSMFSLISKETGQWMGRIGPWQPADWPGTEVGWAVAQEFAGKGFALEAAVASMNYAVDVLGWVDICHTIDPANTDSVKLAERLKSTNRGPTRLPEPYADHPVDNWGQSREQWQENRKQFL